MPDPIVEVSVDYKAELDKVNAELEKKNKELEQARFTLTKNNVDEKNKKGKIFGNNEEETIQPDIDSIVDQKVEARVTQQKAQDFLSKHSSNADEVELAKFHLENTIKTSGNPEADAIAALAIANQKTVLRQKEELKAALLNKNQTLMTSSFPSSEGKVDTNDFSKHLTSEQLNTLRNVHKMDDKQISMFLEKRMSRPR